MYKRLIDRFGAKALSIGVVVAMLGGGAALALPDVAVEGMNEAAENREAAALNREDPPADAGEDESREEDSTDPVIEEPEVDESEVEATAESETQDSESDDRRGPPVEVREFLGELHIWIACIQQGARAHADQQSNPDTRVEDNEYDEADKLDLCGPKPTNPNDTDEDEDSESDDRRGPPVEVREFLGELHAWIACIQQGARAHADQQSNPDTRVENDEYDEADKLDLCGPKPTNPNDTDEDEGEGDLENNGEDGDRGKPEGAGPPDWAGGPPEWAGPPEGAGPPPGAGGPGR